MGCSYYIALVINIDSRLPIVLFVGQHFSGTLLLQYVFCLVEMVDVFYYGSRLPIVPFAW